MLECGAAGPKSYRVVDTTESLRRCIESIRALPQAPDGVVATGDLTDFGRAEAHAAGFALQDEGAQPTHLVPGIHDDRDAMRTTFAGDADPPRAGALDTVVPGEPGGAVDAETLEWLERTLSSAPTAPTVVMMHHPPFSTGIGHMDRIGLAGADALEDRMARHSQVERIICGHLNRSISMRFAGMLASTCPSPAHPVMLGLSDEASSPFKLEPPGFQRHDWRPVQGLVTHAAAIGEHPGPYPFHDTTGLID